MKVIFRVIEVCDIRKQGSQIEVGAILVGSADKSGKRVYFTDKADSQWIFYVGDTCMIVRSCRICGCYEEDCSQCIRKTGEPCHWVEKDLCSACQIIN